MAPAKLLLPPTLFISLLLLMVASHCQVDPTSAAPSSLQKILPSVCVPDETFCSYGFYPNSRILCGGSGVICKDPDTVTMESYQSTSEITEEHGVQTILVTSNQGWLVLGVICIFVVYGFCLGGCRKVPQDQNNMVARRTFPAVDRLELFSSEDLVNATNWLGSKVAWGCLSDGRLVAVKRYDTLRSFDSERRFRTEIRQTGSSLFYSWKHRVQVLLDVATGIEFLHNYAEPRIIHRDIKSETILIDENSGARISGFGNAVLGPEPGNNTVEVDMPAGTPGYMDPECYRNGEHASPWNDVYSFGVVMLETISGKEPLSEDQGLANMKSPRTLISLLDRRVPKPKGKEHVAICRVVKIARRCVKASHKRPAIRAIVAELRAVLELFDP